MISQVAKWGNSQGIRLDKSALRVLGLCVGDTIEKELIKWQKQRLLT